MKFEIPHDLGQDEARRRVEAGLPKLEKHLPSGGTMTSRWSSEYQLELEISAMAQTIPVSLGVGEAVIAGEVVVPTMLRMMSKPIGDFVRTSAEKMLTAR